MTRTELQTWVGLSMVIAHIVVVICAVTVFLILGQTEDLKQAMAVMLPLFVANTAMVVRFLLNPPKPSKAKVPFGKTVLSFLFPGVFFAVLLAVLSIKLWSAALANMNDFLTILGIVETAFAGYVGAVVTALFGENPDG